MSPAERATRAKELAAKNGFALSGIAAIPQDGAAPRALSFSDWLARGLHGPLEYMAHTQAPRTNIRARFPWAQAVLAMGAFYDGKTQGSAGRDLSAHVARYARGRDYHKIFEKRLKILAGELVREGLCVHARGYVDTGPVLERAWAEKAGLGWIGKNACLIHPRLGSFFLLAEIVVDAEFEAGAAATPHCGTCTRCLDACPTQAFSAPGVLDSKRCLVTWNIERRGETPPEFWDAQGSWAAGCDICQTVCPFNAPRRIAEADPELAAPLPWQQMTLAECIVMDAQAFDRAFRSSTLRRTGRNGLRLGAITVAGNLMLEDCREAIGACLGDPDPLIRQRAAWAAAKLSDAAGGSSGRTELSDNLQTTPERS